MWFVLPRGSSPAVLGVPMTQKSISAFLPGIGKSRVWELSLLAKQRGLKRSHMAFCTPATHYSVVLRLGTFLGRCECCAPWKRGCCGWEAFTDRVCVKRGSEKVFTLWKHTWPPREFRVAMPRGRMEVTIRGRLQKTWKNHHTQTLHTETQRALGSVGTGYTMCVRWHLSGSPSPLLWKSQHGIDQVEGEVKEGGPGDITVSSLPSHSAAPGTEKGGWNILEELGILPCENMPILCTEYFG